MRAGARYSVWQQRQTPHFRARVLDDGQICAALNAAGSWETGRGQHG
jgi:hypothetical protein